MESGQRDDLVMRTIDRSILITVLVIGSTLVYLLPQFTHFWSEERNEDRFFTIVFKTTYENKNSEGVVWNFTEDDSEVGLFMNSSWQTVYLANHSCPIGRIKKDGDGNPLGFFSFPESRLRPGENLSYEITYRIVLMSRSIPEISVEDSDTLGDIPEDLKALYCASAGSWQVNDRRLRNLAFELSGNETRAVTLVKRFIVWIRDNIRRESLDIPRYPIETFEGRVGDCDDQANLFITLCRIVGIPAYLQAGCIYVSNKHAVNTYWNGCLVRELTRISWHGWAVIYVPPWGWIPVDLTYVSLDDLRADPLNAAKKSAIIAYPVVQYANVTRADYVGASRDRRDFLIAHDFQIYGQDIMSKETAGEKSRLAALVFPYHLFLVFHVLLVASFAGGLMGRESTIVLEPASVSE